MLDLNPSVERYDRLSSKNVVPGSKLLNVLNDQIFCSPIDAACHSNEFTC
jgi:hypothetical protein